MSSNTVYQPGRNRRWLASLVTLVSIIAVPASASSDENYEKLANMCMACHGIEGSNNFKTIPDLKWQNREYLLEQLRSFKSGERQDITMTKVAQLLSEEDMNALAEYFYAGKKEVN